jgi:predicted ATPase/class 3 adenylate cyclase
MPDLPGGTVTFLFTDIEGSTRLWEEHPDTMRLSLPRHDALLRAAIEANAGVVFKTIGDAFCAAFPTAPQALHAALDARQAMRAESWPAPVVIRVRMALHTGAVEIRDNDYFGQTLNRLARLLAAGHGGQVLLSAATQELVHDVLPSDCSLQSLGAHRLGDLSRPETVFQLLHPDLTADFPPLKSLDNPKLPNNLPRQLTSFVGRERAMEEVKRLLRQTRLLTLTGSGGCGKTRLALQVAADVLEPFPDGVWLVELAPLADPALVPQGVAQALGIPEQAGQTLPQTLTESLQARSLLLLLDNCEHLLAACAQLSATLLRSCPQVAVLATSREPLGVAGELTYRVPSLSSPDPNQTQTPRSLSQYEAVRLFNERAQFHRPDFAVTSQNAPALAQVCYHLDGIPLAIELAAARVRLLSVEDINDRLDNRFRLLTGGDRTALPRHQTLRAAIDWSYDLLNEQERRLLSRLSVFVGGWTLSAAEQICSGGGIAHGEVLDLLTGLADKSLVIAEQQADSARYRLLETVRQYAAEKLTQSGGAEQVRRRHRDWFLGLAEETEPQLFGPGQVRWMGRLEVEHDNLRSALAWCEADAEGAEAGLRLAGALSEFWSVRGYYREGREHLERVLGREDAQARTAARAKALQGAGTLANGMDDWVSVRALFAESRSIREELGDRQGIARSLNNLGIVAMEQGEYDSAQAFFQESLRLHRDLGDRRGIATALGNLGSVARLQEAYTEARALYEQCLVIFKELEDLGSVAVRLTYLGIVAFGQEDYESARALHEESLNLYREIGNRNGVAWALENLGSVVSAQGDYAAARTLLEQSLSIRTELGHGLWAVGGLEELAAVLLAQGYAQNAVRLWGAVAALRESAGSPQPPSGRERYAHQVAQARSALDAAVFAAAWEEGRAMPWKRAVAYALEARNPS